jgi:hypothetical protein
MKKNGKVREIGHVDIPKRKRLSLSVAMSMGADPSDLFNQGVEFPRNWEMRLNHSENHTHDRKSLVRLLIEDQIDLIVLISEWIDDMMECLPKIRDAKIPEVSSFGSSISMSWSDFRKTRWKQIIESMMNSSLEEVPLADFDFYNAGGFKIIRDDCTDIWNVMKRVNRLTPSLAKCLFVTVDDIMSRYNYMSGYFKIGYKNQTRTQLSSKTKRSQRAVKEKYVIEAYVRMVNDKVEKARMASLSENAMAKLIKERAEADLKKVKTSGSHPVLKEKVGRNQSVIFTGLSTKTIIDILRKRDKTKLPFYPWEEKDTSRM